ncbi:MAG: rRNA maturation RNase YbeY [Actinomycetota bacterium]|nr:rRNA maturation RNase YbeY [Actinomycetota bacterium]
MKVEITCEEEVNMPQKLRLKRNLKSAMRKMTGRRNLELSLLLVNEERFRELNRKYLGKDEPSDVLAFPMLDSTVMNNGFYDSGPLEPIGDVVICVPVARMQAREFGCKLSDELFLLAIHGLLHLLGFEDESTQEKEKMREKEKMLLGRAARRLRSW